MEMYSTDKRHKASDHLILFSTQRAAVFFNRGGHSSGSLHCGLVVYCGCFSLSKQCRFLDEVQYLLWGDLDFTYSFFSNRRTFLFPPRILRSDVADENRFFFFIASHWQCPVSGRLEVSMYFSWACVFFQIFFRMFPPKHCFCPWCPSQTLVSQGWGYFAWRWSSFTICDYQDFPTSVVPLLCLQDCENPRLEHRGIPSKVGQDFPTTRADLVCCVPCCFWCLRSFCS